MNAPTQRRGPLARFRVIDLTRVRSGPTCVRQLADWGADVIKIETPPGLNLPEAWGGSRTGADFQNLHRNKRGFTLNLKEADGLKIFKQLTERSDVVAENYRPDVKFRLGIDYESLKKVNKKIVLASISGFGQDGPYVKRPGFDQVTQGMGGLMAITGEPGRGPMRAGCAVSDSAAGLYCALGVLTALLEREASGEGQWVQSNLLQAAIQLLDFQAARYTMSGEVPEQVGNDHPTSMPTSAYATSDGHINVAAAGNRMWNIVCQATGRPELATRPEFKEAEDRAKNRKALNAEMTRALASKTSTEWVDIFNKAGVPCGPIYRMDQVFADPQVKHMQASAEVQHRRLGKLRLINQPVKLSRTPAKLVAATPERGEHTEEVLAGLGFSKGDIEKMKKEGIV